MKYKELYEECPNCIEPDPIIDKMPDGSCGVCGGKGFIIWIPIGKLVDLNQPKHKGEE